MRILFFDRRQHVKEKDFQIMFASDAPKRLKKFSGHAVSLAKSCSPFCIVTNAPRV